MRCGHGTEGPGDTDPGFPRWQALHDGWGQGTGQRFLRRLEHLLVQKTMPLYSGSLKKNSKKIITGDLLSPARTVNAPSVFKDLV